MSDIGGEPVDPLIGLSHHEKLAILAKRDRNRESKIHKAQEAEYEAMKAVVKADDCAQNDEQTMVRRTQVRVVTNVLRNASKQLIEAKSTAKALKDNVTELEVQLAVDKNNTILQGRVTEARRAASAAVSQEATVELRYDSAKSAKDSLDRFPRTELQVAVDDATAHADECAAMTEAFKQGLVDIQEPRGDSKKNRSWGECGVRPELAVSLEANGLPTPWPAQVFVLDKFLKENMNMVMNGSYAVGKNTAAYVVIIEESLARNKAVREQERREKQAKLLNENNMIYEEMDAVPLNEKRNRTDRIEPLAIIVVPTHLLAAQHAMDLREFIELSQNKLTMAVVHGKAPNPKKGDDRNYAPIDILICTAGRLMDLCEKTAITSKAKISLRHLRLVVWDDARQLFGPDLHHERQDHICRVIRHIEQNTLPGKNATKHLIITPSMPVKLAGQVYGALFEGRQVAENYWGGTDDDATLPQLLFIDVSDKTIYDTHQAVANGRPRTAALAEALDICKKEPKLDDDKTRSVLIAVSSRLSCQEVRDSVTRMAGDAKNQVYSLTSDNSPDVNETTLKLFAQGEFSYLVSTQVYAKGLHLPCLPVVVCYEIYGSEEIGSKMDMWSVLESRTRRVGKPGLCITLLDPTRDEDLITSLVTYLTDHKYPIPSFMSAVVAKAAGKTNESVAWPSDRNPSSSIEGIANGNADNMTTGEGASSGGSPKHPELDAQIDEQGDQVLEASMDAPKAKPV
ncbi:ATP-dependent RNA helicase ddx3x [Vermiconidia calcicola]|uniref:ATP-dependent RNA helicase ddx3x n=1 Tax=Vermiconidia calcicola TaxID=1690605 RepID=A0ACC3MMR7_9PEZI|nr:ATP-dependent RNA helicase ddx3x [Vermiconidia calcicola]